MNRGCCEMRGHVQFLFAIADSIGALQEITRAHVTRG